jgi:hypothetical protein
VASSKRRQVSVASGVGGEVMSGDDAATWANTGTYAMGAAALSYAFE